MKEEKEVPAEKKNKTIQKGSREIFKGYVYLGWWSIM